MKVLITGDIHADWKHLNEIINKKRPDIVICCGDFGYWPVTSWYKDGNGELQAIATFAPDAKRIKPYLATKSGQKEVKIYWLPGNHENWWLLEETYKRRAKEPLQMFEAPYLYYCPIGSVLDLNGTKIMFVGGADSIDKHLRTQGFDWFPEEVLNWGDWEWIEKNVKEEIDIVCSHTSPSHFDLTRSGRFDKMEDPSRKMLDAVLEVFQPDMWFFGHWHYESSGQFKNTQWIGLDYPCHGSGRWWHILEI